MECFGPYQVWECPFSDLNEPIQSDKYDEKIKMNKK